MIKKVSIIGPHINMTNQPLKIGCYARVSSDSEDQMSSLSSMISFFESYTRDMPNSVLVGIFTDEGITGTSLEKRDDFNRMMEDARLGKLDMIITKNVPRFARNTVDALNSLRQLKEYGVDVYFEIEQIHSLEANEMLMTILASVAQQHSEEKSNAVRWGYERQFEKGKVYGSNLYGYKSNKGTLEIIEKEAKVVKSIFTMYLSGMSEIQIAKELTQRGVLTKSGKSKWSAGTIGRMLQNEKYCGDALMQKTFNIDFLHKKRYKSIGQRKKFYIENSHPAIISKEIYKEAQVERTKRKSNQVIELNSDKQVSNRRYSAKNPLSNRIICSDCGSLYRRAVWRKRDGTKEPVWRCGNKLVNGKGNCPHSITIKEALLFKLLRHSIQEKFNEKNNLKESLAKILSEYINPKDIKERQEELKGEINKIDEKISQILNKGMLLVSRGVQDESQLEEHLERCYRTKKELNNELKSIEEKLQTIKLGRQNKVLKSLENGNIEFDKMDQEEISVFVKHIVVQKEKIILTTMDEESVEINLDMTL